MWNHTLTFFDLVISFSSNEKKVPVHNYLHLFNAFLTDECDEDVAGSLAAVVDEGPGVTLGGQDLLHLFPFGVRFTVQHEFMPGNCYNKIC